MKVLNCQVFNKFDIFWKNRTGLGFHILVICRRPLDRSGYVKLSFLSNSFFFLFPGTSPFGWKRVAPNVQLGANKKLGCFKNYEQYLLLNKETIPQLDENNISCTIIPSLSFLNCKKQSLKTGFTYTYLHTSHWWMH